MGITHYIPVGLSVPAVWLLAIIGAALALMPGLAAQLERQRWWKFPFAGFLLLIGALGYFSQVHEMEIQSAAEARHDAETRKTDRDLGNADNRIASLQKQVAILVSKVTVVVGSPVTSVHHVLPQVERPMPSAERRNPIASTTHPTTSTPPVPSLQVAPEGRDLTRGQIATLEDRLTPLVGHQIAVYADWRDPESGRFATQFWRLFKSIGINVGQMVGENMYNSSYSPPPIHILCITKAPYNPNAKELQDALTLRGALISAGLMSPSDKVGVQLKPDIGPTEDKIQLQIGPRSAVNE